MAKGGKISGFRRHKNAESMKKVKYAWIGDKESTQGVKVQVKKNGDYYKVRVKKGGGRTRTLDRKKYKPLEKARKRAVKHLRSY